MNNDIPSPDEFDIRVTGERMVVTDLRQESRRAKRLGGLRRAWQLFVAVKILMVAELVFLAIYTNKAQYSVDDKMQLMYIVLGATTLLDYLIISLYLRRRYATSAAILWSIALFAAWQLAHLLANL